MTTRPSVFVGSLGGTITMRSPRGGGAVRPELSAEDLVGAIPQLADVADVWARELAQLPGASLGFADLLGAWAQAVAAVDRGAAGAVLVQGTDTMEESAYLLDLFWDRPAPLVLTGAMRAPDAPGADGPANLMAAVRTAVSPASTGLGVVVVMNDAIHLATKVRKTHASATDAFTSADGPIGWVQEGQVLLSPLPRRAEALPAPSDPGAADKTKVALIETCLGDDGQLLRLAARLGYAGAVVGAFGAGHVSAALAEVVSDVGADIPVVYATRTGAGSTLDHTYDFPGSEIDLRRRGAIPAGWLDPRKARLLLWSLLATGCGRDTIADEFDRRGRR